MDASTLDSLTSGYARAAQALGWSDEGNLLTLAVLFRNWLRTTSDKWLIVLDDLNVDPEDLVSWWPSGPGLILVTTRRDDIGYETFFHPRDVVDLDVYTPDEALNYVNDRLTLHANKLPDGFLDAAPDLVEALGRHPVALNQATAVIIDENLTTGTWLARFADRARTLADLLPQPDIAYDRRTVDTSWSIALDRAATHSPYAVAMATLVSVAHPSSTPRCLFATEAARRYLVRHLELFFSQPSDARTEQLEPQVLVLDDLLPVGDAEAALRALERVAVVRTRPDLWDPITVHTLAQRAIGDLAPDRSAAIVALADAAIEVWPALDSRVGPTLRATIETLLALAPTSLITLDGAHKALFRAGRSLGDAGQVGWALTYFENLLARLDTLAPDHPDTLRTRASIARLRGETGNLTGALAEYEQLLPDMLRVLGPDHPDTLTARHNIAYLQGESGNLTGALDEYERLLSDRLRVLGPNHPDTLTTRANIASWRGDVGDSAGALAEYELLLSDRMRVLGPDHPDTLNTRANIAYWRGALTDYERLLTDQLRVLGADHPNTLNTRANIAYLRSETGALAEYEQLLSDQLRVLGPDHPDTLVTRHQIAVWRGEPDDAPAALAALKDVLADQVRVLGPDHPNTLNTRRNIAYWQERSGDLSGGLTALEDVLADQVRVLGPGHPNTIATREDISHLDSKAAALAELSTLRSTLEDEYSALARMIDDDQVRNSAAQDDPDDEDSVPDYIEDRAMHSAAQDDPDDEAPGTMG